MLNQPRQWKEDYDRDGYLVVEDCVAPQTLARLRALIEKITDDPDALPRHLRAHVQLERDYFRSEPQYNPGMTADAIGNAVRNIMELPAFDPGLAELICYEPLLDVLETLFASGEFHFHNYKCIIKAPKVSSVFRWHRDLPYLYHATPNLITAMLCLDDMTPENGATVVLPGTHRVPSESVTDADKAIPDDKLPVGAEHRMVCCKAGAAVLFHVNIIHGGPANRSPNPRRNVIGIWAGPDNLPVTGARYAYQGLYPRSKNPLYQQQVRLTFPQLFKPPARQPAAAQSRQPVL